MDGLQDETKQVDEVAAQQAQGAPTQVSGDDGAAAGGGETPKVDDGVVQARKDYEAALAERDARIAGLEGEIAEAAKTAEVAEAPCKEMDELRRKGDEERGRRRGRRVDADEPLAEDCRPSRERGVADGKLSTAPS